MKRLFRLSLLGILGVGLCVATMATTARATFIIDHFDTNQNAFILPGIGSSTPTVGTDPNVAGGFRKLSVVSSNGYGVMATSNAVTPSNLTYSSDVMNATQGPNNSTITLTYDGTSTTSPLLNPTLNINALANGQTGVLFAGRTSSNLGVDGTITLYSGSGGSLTSSQINYHFAPSTANQSFFVPFSSFSSGADFAHISAIQVQLAFTGGQGGAGSFDFIEFAPVPEPATLASGLVGGLSLIGLAVVRLRKRATV